MGETKLQKMQNGEYFFAEKHGKIAHGINFAPKIIPGINALCSWKKIICILCWKGNYKHNASYPRQNLEQNSINFPKIFIFLSKYASNVAVMLSNI